MTEDEIKIRKERLAPYMWQKGQSGNPSGRPKGKTVKERAREALMRLSDAEFDKFLLGMDKYDVWRMAEGNPAQDLTSGGEKIQVVPIYGGNSIKEIVDGEPTEPTGEPTE